MLAMNAKEAARVCSTIGIRISHDTRLKILRRVPVPLEQPRIMEIDDFAFKKGHPSVQAMYRQGMSLNAIARSLHLN